MIGSYKIQAHWQVTATITVKAESLSEAIKKAMDEDTSKYETEYLDDSFELDKEFLQDNYNDLGQEWDEAKKAYLTSTR